MRFVNVLRLLPYFLFLILVLAPVGVVAYGLAAIARTVTANVRQGWKDHA